MGRAFFKTTQVHSCFNQLLGELRPKKCRCSKWITHEFAKELVDNGTADWILEWNGSKLAPSWHVVLAGLTGKTPRAQTIEKAHIERAYAGRKKTRLSPSMSDEGAGAKEIEALAMGDNAEVDRIEAYGAIILEARLSFFGAASKDLGELKKASDTWGTLYGDYGKFMDGATEHTADKFKARVSKDDPMRGRACLCLFGYDPRTCPGKNTNLSIPLEEM